jgi:organic radical activating enzyme
MADNRAVVGTRTMSVSVRLRAPWSRVLSLKTDVYLNLALQNLWILGCNAKVRNYVRYRLTPRREVVDTRRAAPVFMTLSLGRRCNLSCRFCIVGDVLNKTGARAHDATLEGTRRVLDHPVARRCLYVMLTGGEPLLNREVVPIARLIKSRHHLLSVNTNGLLLEPHLDDLCAAGVDMLNVSYYDENVAALGRVLPEVSRRIYTKLLKIIGRDDVRDPARIERVVRFARESGCKRLFFQGVYPHVDGLAGRHALPALIEPTGAETAPIGEADATEYARVRADLAARYPDVSIFWPAPVTRLEPGGKRCRMPWYLFVVDGEGNLGFCSAHASCTGPSIFDLSAEQVMNTAPWVETRRALLAPDTVVPAACTGCYTLNDPWRRDM